MKELIPSGAVIAYLLNPSSPNAGFVPQEARSIATALKIQAPVLNANPLGYQHCASRALEPGLSIAPGVPTSILGAWVGKFSRPGH
jgi:hypothetical protein